MKEPYLEQIKKLGKFNAWMVDGAWVRTNLDKEFTNFGQHFRFNFIPVYEFWLDREAVPGEVNFFIKHLLVERAVMDRGLSYAKALEMADRAERAERNKSKIGKISRTFPEDRKIEKIHKDIIWSDSGKLSVWLVDGELVRDLYYIDFTEGGHDFVYDFIPANEVWIDDDLPREERDYVLLHELHERYLMKEHFSYDVAHGKSSELEWKARVGELALSDALSDSITENKR